MHRLIASVLALFGCLSCSVQPKSPSAGTVALLDLPIDAVCGKRNVEIDALKRNGGRFKSVSPSQVFPMQLKPGRYTVQLYCAATSDEVTKTCSDWVHLDAYDSYTFEAHKGQLIALMCSNDRGKLVYRHTASAL